MMEREEVREGGREGGRKGGREGGRGGQARKSLDAYPGVYRQQKRF
jgi:hypothetical protein